MGDHLKQLIDDLHAAGRSGDDLEEKEEMVLQELRVSGNPTAMSLLIPALSSSGTILAVPTLLAFMLNEPNETGVSAGQAISAIRHRAKQRGSSLPDEYYTAEHWKPRWLGSKNSFLSYVSALAAIHARNDEQTEVNRIGEILVNEMGIDLGPYDTFEQYRICATDWDFKEDFRNLLDMIEQERLLAAVQETGIEESMGTFLVDNLMGLRYSYLLTRLRMVEHFEYYKFVLKVAECLNRKTE